jgi:hypothetical protein
MEAMPKNFFFGAAFLQYAAIRSCILTYSERYGLGING